jgi:hypothetical protein
MMVKRAHLPADLCFGAAVIALLAVTSAHTQVWRRARRRADGWTFTVRPGDASGAHCVYPSDAATVRRAQPGRSPRSRRYWDTGEWGDQTIEPEQPQPEHPQPEQPMAAASGARGRPLAAVSASTPPLTSASTCRTPSNAPTLSHPAHGAGPNSRPVAKRCLQR